MKHRAAEFVSSLEEHTSPVQMMTALEISTDGIHLRSMLDHWQATNMLPVTGYSSSWHMHDLAQVFHAAASIYLSGVYDYELVYWQRLGIVVPTLSEDDIQMHVATIIVTSQRLLRDSTISPLLLLFPLRVAGARSWSILQQSSVMGCLKHIENTFSVATAFRQQLTELWATR